MTQSVSETLKDMRRPTVAIPYLILAAISIFGFAVAIYQRVQGGYYHNLSHAYPWGAWITFYVFGGVFAAGGFTLAAVVYIFRRKEYHGIALPVLLAGLLGYVMVLLVLLMDLGRPDQFWNALLPWRWNGSSFMIWVALSLTCYIVVTVVELLPVAFERFNWEPALRIFRPVAALIAGLAIVAATMYQLSVGGLFVLAPFKLHPLWYTPLLPLMFYVSTIFGGLCAAILVTMATLKLLNRSLPLRLLSGLARATWVLLIIYLVIKVLDLLVAGELGMAFDGSLMSLLFLAEMVVGVIAPIVLFGMSSVRKSAGGLLAGTLCALFGLVLNRASVIWFALAWRADVGYFPHWIEFAVVVAAITAAVLIYGLGIRFFPFLPEAASESR